ncbi:hypothetical protein [Klebsiella pneumoniae]
MVIFGFVEECWLNHPVTAVEPNETGNQEKYARYLCPIKLLLGQKLCGIFNSVERGTSRHAKIPAIIDTVDPERDKGSCIAYLDAQFFNHYVPTLQLWLSENALSVHEYVLNDGIGCLTRCNPGTGLDICSERCFRLKIIQRDKSAQQQHNARHTQTNTLQEPGHITSPIAYG